MIFLLTLNIYLASGFTCSIFLLLDSLNGTQRFCKTAINQKHTIQEKQRTKLTFLLKTTTKTKIKQAHREKWDIEKSSFLETLHFKDLVGTDFRNLTLNLFFKFLKGFRIFCF